MLFFIPINFVLIYFIKIDFFGLIDVDILKNNNNIWQALFYLNNNNNSVFVFFNIFILLNILVKNTFKKSFFWKLLIVWSLTMLLNINYFNSNILEHQHFSNNNLPLSNGVLLIHPICVYLSYVNLIIFFYKDSLSYLVKTNLTPILNISLLALFLGSYWAQQELNWGGWWNWDYVELIAFIFFLFIVFFLHLSSYFLEKSLKVFFKIDLYWYFLLFFILVRCDILESIHSFNSFNFLDKYLYYICSLFIFSIFFVNFKKYFKKKYDIFQYNKSLPLGSYFVFFIFSVVIFIVYNILIYVNTNTQFINSFYFFKLLLFLIFFITSFNYFFKINIFIMVCACFFLKNTAYIYTLTVVLFFLNFFKKKLFYIHFCITIFTIFCLSYNYVFIEINRNVFTNIVFQINYFIMLKQQSSYIVSENLLTFLSEIAFNSTSSLLGSGVFNYLNVNSITYLNKISYYFDSDTIIVLYKNIVQVFVITIYLIIYLFWIKRNNHFKVV